MRNIRRVTLTLIVIIVLALCIVLFVKQYKKAEKYEQAFHVALSSTLIDYQMIKSLDDSLGSVFDDEKIYFNEDNYQVNHLTRDLKKLSYTYQDLHQYYLPMYDYSIENHLTGLLQDFSYFLEYIYKVNNHLVLEDDEGKYIKIQDEAYEVLEIISTVINDLNIIRGETFENEKNGNEQSLKIIVEKNEEYVQSNETQQSVEKIREMIKFGSLY